MGTGLSVINIEGEMKMKKRTRVVVISMLIICTLAVNMLGCSKKSVDEKSDLMKSVTPNEIKEVGNLGPQNEAVTDFAIRLFKACETKDDNTLISPLSVLCALSMTTNGAEKETLEQMESVLGMDADALNQYIYAYMKNLPKGEKYKLSLANSIWFTDDSRFTVNQDFLQVNADYYGADFYKAPFNEQTCTDINNWVKENTDEMIPEILREISGDAVMYLVNALAFEAEWAEIYEMHQVNTGRFTMEDGTSENVELMHGTEKMYLEDEKATGFMKYYKDDKYAFVAMLPNEGVSVSEYVASLNGESLNKLLMNPQNTTVYTSIPKFETEYDIELSNILMEMGMQEAFDPLEADFGRLGTSNNGNVYISSVIHKTFISVGENGTKAGAATIVEMTDGMAMLPQDVKEVYLDRPFVYMLIDCENNIPFFIGTMMHVN